MKSLKVNLPTEEASVKIAERMAACLCPPLVLAFQGEIGAGKTTFIRAMLRFLGVNSVIKSPTFSFVESYQGTHMLIHHFDLYRIQDDNELETIGFYDYFSNQAICCIEWPEKASSCLASTDVLFTLHTKEMGRVMQIRAMSDHGAKVLFSFKGESSACVP